MKTEKTERETAEKIARAKEEQEVDRNAREKMNNVISKEVTQEKIIRNAANFRWLGMGGIALLALVLGGFGLNYLVKNLPVTTAAIPTPITSLSPSSSVTFNLTDQPTETPIPISILDIGSTEVSTKDGMVSVYVPEGVFIMGSDVNSYEQPIHQVSLDAFWIDQIEVTNAMYAKCVAANKCNLPDRTWSYTRPKYYGNSEFDNYPVIFVSWNDAFAYCSWAERELPTEAQWEKAARGTDGRIYPWGNEMPNSSLLNYKTNTGDTTMTKNYPDTDSFYGTYDMAGNVWEWVNDWYGENYYQSLEAAANPGGPESGQARVLRGGSWSYNDDFVRSSSRDGLSPTKSDSVIGFRCSHSP